MSFYGESEISFPNLGIYIKNLPVGIDIYGFQLAFYGLFMVAALLAAWFTIEKQVKNQNDAIEFYIDLLFHSIPSAVIGAKLFYILFSFEKFLNNPLEELEFSTSKLVMYGGLVFVLITVVVFCRSRKRNFFGTADVLVLGILVAQIFAKCGHFFSRQDIGIYSDNLFAIRIKNIAGTYGNLLLERETYLQGHPTFLYEMLWNVLLLIIILNVKKRCKTEGILLLVYVIGYGIGSMLIEPIRRDNISLGNTDFPVTLILAIVLMALSIVHIVLKSVIKEKKA